MPLPESPPGLHPLLAAGVAARRSQPRYQDVGIAEARALNRRRNLPDGATPPIDLFAVEALQIAGPGGTLPLRLYRPSAERPLPLLVYLHGGGFVAGDLDTHDTILRRLAREACILILSVDYRLAPEHPFPAAVDDARAATVYALEAAEALGAGAILVGGDSAGGALAAAAAAGVPELAGLVLLYPVTDLSRIGESESYRLFGDGRAGLSTDDMLWNSGLYAPHPISRGDWRCSPLLLPPGMRLPPTLVLTAEFDVLRSDGEAFAHLLGARGVAVTRHRMTGVNHGFLGAPDAVPQVSAAFATIAAWIKSEAGGAAFKHRR